jgi:hypothetical protein
LAATAPAALQAHYIACIPCGRLGKEGEGLAALCWAPPSSRCLLLAVTASGAAYAWAMHDPPGPRKAAAEGNDGRPSTPSTLAASSEADGGGLGSKGGVQGRGSCHVSCINQWFGRFAFQLPVGDPAAGADEPPAQPRPRLLCCKFLATPSLVTAWDASAAPPFDDRWSPYPG